MVIFSMGGWKALGLDDLPSMFYQSNWDHVGGTLTCWVMNVLSEPTRISEMNSTYISLIPKIDSPEYYSHFRPISLCNVNYKDYSFTPKGDYGQSG